MSRSEILRVDRLGAAWGSTPVLDGVSFSLSEGEFVVLVGPNGSGKTTLLRCLAGLERPTDGRVLLGGEDVRNVPTHRRGLGFVFQEAALFPNRSVAENIAYGLEMQRLDPTTIDRRVAELAGLLELDDLTERLPPTLSGGERQRVALARSLAPRPKLLLLDEPFANVDPELRGRLRADLKRALSVERTAAIHVTHDRDEGLLLGERLLVLIDGHLVRDGTPADVYADPQRADVARFLGQNVLETAQGPVAVPPRSVLFGEDRTGVPAIVRLVGPSADGRVALVELEGGGVVEAHLASDGPRLTVGDRVGLRWTDARPLARDPPSGL